MPVASESLFCRGCNESFAVATADRRCPQCGEVLTAYELAPTLDLDLTLMADRGLGVQADTGPSEALIGKTWNHPVIAHDRLLVRNSNEAACFELIAGSPEKM